MFLCCLPTLFGQISLKNIKFLAILWKKKIRGRKSQKKLSSWLILMVQHKCQKRENALINLTWRAILSYDSGKATQNMRSKSLWGSILILCPYNFHNHIKHFKYLKPSWRILLSIIQVIVMLHKIHD